MDPSTLIWGSLSMMAWGISFILGQTVPETPTTILGLMTAVFGAMFASLIWMLKSYFPSQLDKTSSLFREQQAENQKLFREEMHAMRSLFREEIEEERKFRREEMGKVIDAASKTLNAITNVENIVVRASRVNILPEKNDALHAVGG